MPTIEEHRSDRYGQKPRINADIRGEEGVQPSALIRVYLRFHLLISRSASGCHTGLWRKCLSESKRDKASATALHFFGL
jgi:hypothetical protein